MPRALLGRTPFKIEKEKFHSGVQADQTDRFDSSRAWGSISAKRRPKEARRGLAEFENGNFKHRDGQERVSSSFSESHLLADARVSSHQLLIFPPQTLNTRNQRRADKS